MPACVGLMFGNSLSRLDRESVSRGKICREDKAKEKHSAD